MELYLVRHGDAVPLGEQGIQQDEDRPLTELGRAQSRAVGAMLRQRVAGLSVVFTSPLVRAKQTAEGMLAVWVETAPVLELCKRLAPGLRPRKLARSLSSGNAEKIALVGHQPDLGMFAAWLIGSRKAQIALAKGGVACIEVDGNPARGTGCLVWMITPEWLGMPSDGP